MKHRILIAVCTRRRPVMLARCLDSLTGTRIPEGTEVHLLAVENDTRADMANLIREMAQQTDIPMQHLLETRQGIPFARNRALDAALQNEFDYLVFLDDDEWVEEDWLVNLYDYAMEKGGHAVIHGRVISDFPERAPEHLKPLIQRKPKPTGTPLESCATNNVLIPVERIRKSNLRFDERNPYAGGEDVLFFFAASRQGVQIFECREAVVHEEIPLNRMSLRWLAKRKYWMGIGQLKRDLQRGEKAWILFPKAVCSLVLRSIILFFSIIFNRKQFSKHWLKLCKNTGTIGGLLGRETEAYRTVDGG